MFAAIQKKKQKMMMMMRAASRTMKDLAERGLDESASQESQESAEKSYPGTTRRKQD